MPKFLHALAWVIALSLSGASLGAYASDEALDEPAAADVQEAASVATDGVAEAATAEVATEEADEKDPCDPPKDEAVEESTDEAPGAEADADEV